MRHIRTRLVAAAGITVSLALSSCAGNAGGNSSSVDGKPVEGGTLIVGTPPDSGCIDPQQVQQRAVLSITRQVTDSLVYQNPESGEAEPWLAEDWEISTDGRTYTFALRDDVTFSDGTALTADVVKANLDAVAALGARAIIAGPYVKGMTSTKVIDEHTVAVEFEKPDAQFLQAVSTPSLGIVAMSTLQQNPDQRCQGDIVGSGPFTLDDFTTGQGATLTRRNQYAWAPASFENAGDAYLDSIEFRMVPDASVRVGSLVSEQIDLTTELQPQDLPQLVSAGMDTLIRPNPGFPNTLFINPERPPLNDPAVRQALQIGFDRAEVTATTLTEEDLPATGALSSTTPGYTDLSDLLADDPDRARDVLDEAGWELGSDGVRVRDGQRAEFKVMYFTPIYLTYVPLLELMRQQYAEIGIDMKLEPVPLAAGVERQIAFDFDARMSGQTRADPAVLGSQIFTGDEELNELLAGQAEATDPEARMPIVESASRMLLEKGYVVPIHELTLPMSFTSAVHGLSTDATNGLLLSGVWKTD